MHRERQPIINLKHGQSHIFNEWQEEHFEVFMCNGVYLLFITQSIEEYMGTYNTIDKLMHALENEYSDK